MPYFNKSTKLYDCFPILDIGPCQAKEWFVLDKNNPKQAKCVEQKCACGPVSDYNYEYDGQSDDYFESKCKADIEEKGYLFIDFNGKCEDYKDTMPCPFGQWLEPDVFGDGRFSK